MLSALLLCAAAASLCPGKGASGLVGKGKMIQPSRNKTCTSPAQASADEAKNAAVSCVSRAEAGTTKSKRRTARKSGKDK